MAPELRWHGVHEFGQAVSALNARVEHASTVGSIEAGETLAAITEAEAPHGKTGELRRSIVTRYQTVRGQRTVRVGPTAPYGRRVDLGFRGTTKKGKQRRKAVLSSEIFGPSGKGVRVGSTTRGLHTTRPNPFLQRALAVSAPRVVAVYRRAWAKAITK